MDFLVTIGWFWKLPSQNQYLILLQFQILKIALPFSTSFCQSRTTDIFLSFCDMFLVVQFRYSGNRTYAFRIVYDFLTNICLIFFFFYRLLTGNWHFCYLLSNLHFLTEIADISSDFSANTKVLFFTAFKSV